MTDPPPPSVTAIILSYRNPQAVLRCVASLRQSRYPGLTILVVDNASGPATEAILHEGLPGCALLVTERNLGFGGGCNLGLEAALAAGAAYILLLNQDTIVAPDMVERLVGFMEACPAAGIVGPRTFFGRGSPVADRTLLYAGSWRRLLPLRQRVPGIGEVDVRTDLIPMQTDYIWGHGMMLRRAALETVGLFDPAYFMYTEDLDLCRRVGRAGFQLWCEPQATMWHDIEDGARAKSSDFWRWGCKVHSTRVFHRKHFGGLAGFVLSALTIGAEAQQLLRQRYFRALGHLLLAYGRSLVLHAPVYPPHRQ